MSTREEVLNSLFHYICIYLKDNGEECSCCSPTTFTFDAINDGKTNTDLIIHTWAYQNIPSPTINNLLYITPETVQKTKKLYYIQNNQGLITLISSINQTRTLLSLPLLTENEKIALVDDSQIF